MVHAEPQEIEMMDDEDPRANMLDRMGAELRGILDDHIGQRQQIEERWLADARQYHGEAQIKNEDGTDLRTPKLTRSKTNAGEARLTDLLFPNDDKNWAIDATPVPMLAIQEADDTPVRGPQGEEYTNDDTGEPVTRGDLARREREIADERSDLMELEIEDQLDEAHYAGEARGTLHYAAMLGTGILKGPIVEGRVRKAWIQNEHGQHELKLVRERRPGVRCVAPWDFVPDMSATHISEANFTFERRYLSERQVISLAQRQDVDPDQIRRVLRNGAGATQTHSRHVNELRALSGIYSNDENRYEIWEYRGQIEKQYLVDLGKITENDEATDDPLDVYDGVVWLAGPLVIRVELNPLPDESSIYSVFNWEEDEACIFGYGVPYLCRNSQAVAERAWADMLANADATTGDQIVVNRNAIEPANGKWEIKGRKIWYATGRVQEVDHAFRTYGFNNYQNEYANVFQMARQLMDEETSLPMLAQGEQGTASQTLGGMAMLMNSHTTVLRRQVKRWDDDITTPLIGRFYDWNMMFNPKQEIKGDMSVVARGSSALLAKELVGQQLERLLNNYAAHPVLGHLLNAAEGFRKLVQSMHLSADDLVKSDEEIRAEMEEQQAAQEEQQGGQGEGGGDPMLQLKQQELALKENEQQIKLAELQSNERIKIMELELKGTLSREQAEARYREARMKEKVRLHTFNQEMKIKMASGSGI